jgi:hypothetical protein
VLIREFLQTATPLLPDQSTTERYGQVKAELAGIGKLIPDKWHLDSRHGPPV